MATRHVTRRSLLRSLGSALLLAPAASLAAACGAPSAALTPAPAQPTPSPASNQASGTTPARAAGPTPQAATAGGTSAAKPITVWYGKDYLDATTDTLQKQLNDFAAKNNAKVDFEVKSGAWTDQLNAAVQAGTAPDIWQSYDYQCQYWNAQGQALEISPVINKYKGQQGGFFPYVVATVSSNGKTFAAPLATNTWPFHARQDILDQENGGKFPDTWDLQREIGRKITNAPKLYAYGWTMGKTNDTNNHFIGTLWTFGGKLQNEDGSFGLKPNDEAAIAVLELAQNMYAVDKILPPAVVQWDDGGNNNSYQEEQVAWTSNPLSIYGWCQQHKPELAAKTNFYNYPKGPAGSFGQVDVWGVTAWKKTPQQDLVLAALDWLVDPAHHAERIRMLAPRFTPIYQDLLNDQVWDKPLFAGIKEIARTGRIMAYAASPQAGYSTFTTRYLIGEMMQNVIVKKMTPKEAYNQFYQAAKAVYEQY